LSAFLEKANALWPNAEVVLRSKRVADVIAQHDEWLKDRRDYDTPGAKDYWADVTRQAS
jgi:hypothetical protein